MGPSNLNLEWVDGVVWCDMGSGWTPGICSASVNTKKMIVEDSVWWGGRLVFVMPVRIQKRL